MHWRCKPKLNAESSIHCKPMKMQPVVITTVHGLSTLLLLHDVSSCLHLYHMCPMLYHLYHVYHVNATQYSKRQQQNDSELYCKGNGKGCCLLGILGYHPPSFSWKSLGLAVESVSIQIGLPKGRGPPFYCFWWYHGFCGLRCKCYLHPRQDLWCMIHICGAWLTFVVHDSLWHASLTQLYLAGWMI